MGKVYYVAVQCGAPKVEKPVKIFNLGEGEEVSHYIRDLMEEERRAKVEFIVRQFTIKRIRDFFANNYCKKNGVECETLE